MKKVVALAAAGVLAFTLAGCSSGAEESANVISQNAATNTAPSASTQTEQASQKEEIKDLIIAESGWSAGSSGYVHYGIRIQNPNQGHAAQYPVINITQKDAEGNVIASDKQTLFFILPGTEVAWGGQAGNGTAPATVEFSVTVNDSNGWLEVPDGFEPYNPMEAVSVTETTTSIGTSNFAGEVKNNMPDQSNAQISVLLRNDAGEIVGGFGGFASNIPSGGTMAYEVSGYQAIPHTSISAYAMPWS